MSTCPHYCPKAVDFDTYVVLRGSLAYFSTSTYEDKYQHNNRTEKPLIYGHPFGRPPALKGHFDILCHSMDFMFILSLFCKATCLNGQFSLKNLVAVQSRFYYIYSFSRCTSCNNGCNEELDCTGRVYI